jgi:N-methylhydantoinase A
MDTPHEIVNLRAVALGQALDLPAAELPKGDGNPIAAKMRDHMSCGWTARNRRQ